MNNLDLLCLRLPGWLFLAATTFTIVGLAASLAMVGMRLLWKRPARLVRVAYRKPRFVRTVNSPVWTGALLLTMGLLYVQIGVRWPSMDARVYAVAHRVWRARATGDLTAEVLHTARREQAPWVALREAGTTTLGAWEPSPEISIEANTTKAAALVAKAHVLEVLGMVLIGLGLLLMVVLA